VRSAPGYIRTVAKRQNPLVRLLVTGGAGFIGSNFIRQWLRGHESDEVINLDALTYAGDRRSLTDVVAERGPRYRFVHGDIADRALVEGVIRESPPDVVVNFAAETHNSRAVIDPTLFTRTNVVGTHTLLEVARLARVPRFHHISTCEVYGDLALDSDELFTESSPYRPRTPYNASKAAADLLVRAYHETYGMAVTISNCSNNYGPYQHPEKVIPLFTTNALDDRPLPLYRHSANRREWLHVDDHCRAIELVVTSGRAGETYNVGSGDERSVEEIADAVLGALGKSRALVSYVEDRPGHDRRYVLDHSKIERELGWRPRVPFADGLAATVRWYADHRDWWTEKKERLGTELDEFAWRR
jgi:dTDP-glucose 4,6-dehydratase